MKKYLLRFIIIFALALGLSPALYSENLTATINIDTKNPLKDTTSRMIFGAFIEFITDYVNGPNGMWSQELLDRGFDINDYSLTNLPKVWNEYQTSSLDSVLSLKGGYNINGEYFKRLVNNTSSRVGIYQTIVATDSISYTFYVYCKSDSGKGHLKLGVYDASMKNELFTYDFGIPSSNWQKVQVKVPAIKGHNRLNYCIYSDGMGSIDIDEASCMPNDNFMGIRREYYELLKNMNMGLFRYPGGWYADCETNKLEYCIGDIDMRKSPNLKNGYEFQRMDMGLDEIVNFCKALKSEMQITMNLGTGTPQEAANYVEYCNGSEDSKFGKLRAENGNKQPYNIKLWEIGNEQECDRAYVMKYLAIYDKIKETDPSINAIIDGDCWIGKKCFDTLMTYASDKCEFYGYHPSIGLNTDYSLDTTDIYYSTVSVFNEIEKNNVKPVEDWLKSRNLFPRILQGATEWWSSYSSRTHVDWLVDTNRYHNSLTMALLNANMINVYLRNSSSFKFAERTIGIGLIRRAYNQDGSRSIYGMSPYQAISMQGRHFGTHVFPVDLNIEKYNVEWKPGLFGCYNVPWLDVTATGSHDTLFLSVINRNPDKRVDTYFNFKHKVASNKVYELYSDYYMDYSTAENPLKISEKEKNIKVTDFYSFPPHSLTILAFYIPNLISYVNDTINNEVKIITNKNANELQVQFKNHISEPVDLSIYDLTGRICYRTTIMENVDYYTMNNIYMATGAYIIKLSSKSVNFSKVFIWF